MDLYHALKKARIYQKKLSLIIKMFAQEAEYHMNVITGQKSCSHHNLNHAHHLSYHHEMMVSCDEHSLSLHPYKDFVDDVAWTLQDLVWKREGQLEDQKLIRILNTIYNQAEHKPMTR